MDLSTTEGGGSLYAPGAARLPKVSHTNYPISNRRSTTWGGEGEVCTPHGGNHGKGQHWVETQLIWDLGNALNYSTPHAFCISSVVARQLNCPCLSDMLDTEEVK